MSPGYGERIYVKRSRKKGPIITISFMIAIVAIVLILVKPDRSTAQKNETRPEASVIPETDIASLAPETITSGETGNEEQPAEKEKQESPAPTGNNTQRPIGNQEKDDASILLEARSLIQQRNYNEALAKLIPLTQTSPLAMMLASEAQYALQHYDECRTLLERYLETNHGDLSAIKRLVVVCYELNDLEEALAYCDKGLEINEKDLELIATRNKISSELKTASGFTSRESLHFTVSFDRGHHDDSRQTVLSILESAYREIGLELGVYPERSIPVILYTRKSFFDVTRSPGWAGGLYDGKIRLPVAGLTGNGELNRILYHEYVHALVSQLTSQCPRWLNEGLAEYFSQDDVPEIGQIIPLSQLEFSFPASPVRAVAAAYAESHAAVNYLIERYSLTDLLNLLKKLGEGKTLSEAFEEIFYSSYPDFLESWGQEG